MMFRTVQPFPGITHITDAMGVSCTLIEGKEKAVLFDTGYGTEDIAAFVRKLTQQPVTVLLSHGHHDHVLGARWFEKTNLCTEDMEEFRIRTGETQRKRVMKQAESSGIDVPDDFLTADFRMPEPIAFTGKAGPFDSFSIELGCKTLQVIRVPGHTPGSIVAFVPEHGLLLTGDDWNPCTWMWFPSSLNVQEWRRNMITLIAELEESGTVISHVICSHQPTVREGQELKEFLAWMNDERLINAPKTDMGSPIDTHQVIRNDKGWTLVFDRAKIRMK